MSEKDLKTRVVKLEKELAAVKSELAVIKGEPKRPWWMDQVGIFADDPMHEEAMRLGREWRKAQREDYDANNN